MSRGSSYLFGIKPLSQLDWRNPKQEHGSAIALYALFLARQPASTPEDFCMSTKAPPLICSCAETAGTLVLATCAYGSISGHCNAEYMNMCSSHYSLSQM